MGSWGPGVFDNDAARDHLFEVTRDLAERIENALAGAISLRLAGPSTVTERVAMLETVLPNIEMICVLHDAIGGGYLPEPETAAEWQSQFEQLDSARSPERDAVVRKSFEWLQRLALQCWEA